MVTAGDPKKTSRAPSVLAVLAKRMMQELAYSLFLL
jgi:hypothetical protein